MQAASVTCDFMSLSSLGTSKAATPFSIYVVGGSDSEPLGITNLGQLKQGVQYHTSSGNSVVR